MKKILFFALIAMASMTMSCGGGQTAGNNENDSTIVDSIEVVDSTAIDSLAADTVVVDSLICNE